ncbi:MAG TPA: hypothetical protein VFJ05_01155 [Nitrososphaeraceae archaeon]|nr:hypothetical protein [Nitrososphaeraceae archaeon]
MNDFRDNLGKAGSFLSFVTAAYDLCQQIQNELKTEEERAYNLLKFVLKTTKEFLKSLVKRGYIESLSSAVVTPKTNEIENYEQEEGEGDAVETIDKNSYDRLKQELHSSFKQSAGIFHYSIDSWDSQPLQYIFQSRFHFNLLVC